jgi:uroporphyrinogen-III synthase
MPTLFSTPHGQEDLEAVSRSERMVGASPIYVPTPIAQSLGSVTALAQPGLIAPRGLPAEQREAAQVPTQRGLRERGADVRESVVYRCRHKGDTRDQRKRNQQA